MKQIVKEATDKIVSQQAYDLLAKEIFTLLKEKAGKVHTHSADDITDSATKKVPTIEKQTEWDNKVDEAKLQEEINKIASGLSWKGVFTTLAELRQQITQPTEGDFVVVTQEPTYSNKNTILIYEAETVNDWQSVGDLFVPSKATQNSDGLMSKEDKTKIDGITDDKLLSSELKAKYDKASTDATSSLQKVTTVENSLSAVEEKLTNVLTVEEAQEIVNKYKV